MHNKCLDESTKRGKKRKRNWRLGQVLRELKLEAWRRCGQRISRTYGARMKLWSSNTVEKCISHEILKEKGRKGSSGQAEWARKAAVRTRVRLDRAGHTQRGKTCVFCTSTELYAHRSATKSQSAANSSRFALNGARALSACTANRGRNSASHVERRFMVLRSLISLLSLSKDPRFSLLSPRPDSPIPPL